MTVPVPPLVASLGPVVERISDLERKVEALTSQVAQLLWQAPTWNAALTQKAPDTDRYVELRRALKVIGLTEILAEWTKTAPLMEWDKLDKIRWPNVCAELFERYGHLQLDGKPLWAGPPKPPSPETRALIAECLRRHQEA
jgi:hypothetical protein